MHAYGLVHSNTKAEPYLGYHDASGQYMLKCSDINTCKEFLRVAFFMNSWDK